MSEEIQEILNKFDGILKNYELDKAFGQLSVDSICHLFPSEIIIIKNYIQQKENTIKEVREEVRILESNCDISNYHAQKLYQALDKEGVN